MSESECQTSPMLQSTDCKDHKNNNSSTKIVLGAIFISLIILIIVNLPNLHSSSLSFWRTNNQTVIGYSGRGNHRSSAVLIKDIKVMEGSEFKIPKVDRNSKFIQRFTLNGPEISYNGPNQKWTQLLAHNPIPYNETFKSKVLMIFSANNHLMFGITNHERITTQSSFFNEDTYAYYGHNGCLWAEGQLMLKDQIGYTEKDVVEVDVQLWLGLIQWKVNGAVRGQIYSQKLKNADVKYVPYLQMFQKNDSIRMIP